MKKIMKAALILLTLMIAPTSIGVSAARKAPVTLNEDSMFAKAGHATLTWSENVKINYEKLQIISMKSSKPKVIKPVKDKETNRYYFDSIKALKPGKSKITITYKYKGKKYTSSAVYTVKKNPDPVKALYVNGKKVKIKKRSYEYLIRKYAKSNVKIKIVPKKGWRIEDCYAYNQDDSFSAKNGGKLKVIKGQTTTFGVSLINKKYERYYYQVLIER